MKYEYFIGLRYLRAKRKQTMISVITLISIAGVALGVAALIIVLAVMTGFEDDLRQKILGANAHIVIVPNDSSDYVEDYHEILAQVRTIPGIKSAEPFVYNKVMIACGDRSDGIILKGTDPALGHTSELQKNMIDGVISDLSARDVITSDSGVPQPNEGIILGVELASSLAARKGDVVTLTASTSSLTPIGFIPKSKSYRVVGYFSTGMYEYDKTMAYLSIESAQKLLAMNSGINGLEVRAENIFDTDSIVTALRQKMGPRFWIRDWKDMNRSFFSALKLEKLAMFIILTLIVFVAAFNIISSLTMMVMEKSKDIGILKAMGATNASVRLIFLTEGVIIGVVGTAVGCITGITLSWIADTYHLIRLAGEVYYISYLPFKVKILDVTSICLASLVISFIATIYPARQAARLDPVESIRYE